MSVCFYNGRISFNGPTCELLGYKKGDAIAFYRDLDSKGQPWYIAKEKVPGALLLRLSLGKMLYGVDAHLARELTASADDSVRFILSEEKLEGKYWKLLKE